MRPSFRYFARAVVGAALSALGSHLFGATLTVTTYGAIANDAGDDRATIQSAINAAAAGDTVLFPAGTFRLSGAIYPPKPQATPII